MIKDLERVDRIRVREEDSERANKRKEGGFVREAESSQPHC